MKIFKKLSAITAALAAALVMSVNVSAEENDGRDYVYRDLIAEDGAIIHICYSADENGELWFSSGTIDAPVPKDPDDFLNNADPDGDYQVFMSGEDFIDYIEELPDIKNTGRDIRYVSKIAEFDVEFDPPINDVTRIYGGKCYIADLEKMTAHYVGYYLVWEEIAVKYEEPNDVYEYTAEDGAKFYLYFSKESGEYNGCLSDEAEFDYAIDNINGTVTILDVDTGYKLYSDPDDIPLAENEVLLDIDFEKDVEVSDHLICVVSGKKFYVVTVDGINSTVRYMGHSAEYRYISLSVSYDDTSPVGGTGSFQQPDGATASPKTGNGGEYLKIMLAAAGLAVLAKFAKK